MKSKTILSGIALGLSFFSQQGEAADSPIYLRGAIGESSLSSDLGYFKDSSATRYEFGLGWRLASWASVEAVRFDYETLDNSWPEQSSDPAENTVAPLAQKFDLAGYAVSALFNYSVGSRITVFTRQGIAFTETEYMPDPNDTREWIHGLATNKDTAKYRGSVGVSLELPALKSSDLSVEFIREDGYDVSAESVNVGFAYQF